MRRKVARPRVRRCATRRNLHPWTISSSRWRNNTPSSALSSTAAPTTTGSVRPAVTVGTSLRCSYTSRRPTSSRPRAPTAISISTAPAFSAIAPNRKSRSTRPPPRRSISTAPRAATRSGAVGTRRHAPCAPPSLREIRIERVTWVSGQLSLHTLTATRLSEAWIHTGDIASALGVDLAPTDRLRHIARLAWRTLPYAFDRAGRS